MPSMNLGCKTYPFPLLTVVAQEDQRCPVLFLSLPPSRLKGFQAGQGGCLLFPSPFFRLGTLCHASTHFCNQNGSGQASEFAEHFKDAVFILGCKSMSFSYVSLVFSFPQESGWFEQGLWGGERKKCGRIRDKLNPGQVEGRVILRLLCKPAAPTSVAC